MEAAIDARSAISTGIARLSEDGSGLRAAVAPRGPALKFLLDPAKPPSNLSQIAICSRQRLSALIRAQSGDRDRRCGVQRTWRDRRFADGEFGSDMDADRVRRRRMPRARGDRVRRRPKRFAGVGLDHALARLRQRPLASHHCVIAGQEPQSLAAPPPDDQLPVYTVIVALYREAPVVKKLVRALDALDYPRAKLDIKLVLERSDRETLAALAALRLPARYDVIVAPQGAPLTKPRALNIALSAAKGGLLVVYDAEDVARARSIAPRGGALRGGSGSRLPCRPGW